jgi:hypothetical protein
MNKEQHHYKTPPWQLTSSRRVRQQQHECVQMERSYMRDFRERERYCNDKLVLITGPKIHKAVRGKGNGDGRNVEML